MRGMHETTPIIDIYCSGLGAVEDLGSDLRFYLYVLQTPECGGAQEKIIVAKLIMPKASVPDAVMQSIAAIGDGIGIQLIGLVDSVTH